jgi:hypothetical protein
LEITYDGLEQVREALQAGFGELVVVLNSYYLYCDAAGGQDHGFIVVAGWLSTFEKWNVLVSEWNRDLLACFDVPYFHMKEFAQSTGPFASWKGDETKRARFMERAAGIIGNNVERGLSCIVPFEDFRKVNELYHLDEAVGVPYSLAGRTCVARTSIVIGRDKEAHYVFEDGDEGKGQLLRVMDRDGYSSPIFRPSRDRIGKDGQKIRGVVPLQTADFAAYEMRKVYKDDPGELWPLERYRKSLRALAALRSEEEDWGKYTEKDLIELCTNGKVPLRPATAIA